MAETRASTTARPIRQHMRRGVDPYELRTPGVAPLLGRSPGGAITFSRPESEGIDLAVTRVNTDRGYMIIIGALRKRFPGWRPEWHNASGLNDWLDRMRGLMPDPCPPRVTARWGSAPALNPFTGPLVYFVRISNMIKIGYSGNLRERVGNLGVTMAQVVAVEPGDPDREGELHRQFAHLRKFGEWFRAEPDLLGYIATIRQERSSNDRAD